MTRDQKHFGRTEGVRSAAVRAARRLGAAVCLGGAYQAAVSQFDVQWVALTAFGALLVSSGPPHWTLPEVPPPSLPWPRWAVLRIRFLPAWLLMTSAAGLKLAGVSVRLVLWLWCAGTLWLLIGAWRSSQEMTTPARRVATRSTWAWTAVVLGLVVALRAWSIDTAPRQVHPDEALTARIAQAFYADPGRDWLGAFGQGMNLYAALPGAGIPVFGFNVFGARAGDMLFGTLSVLLLFDALRRVASLRVAVVGALLLAVNHCHIAYSRSAAGYVQPAFTVTLLFAIAARLWTAPTYFNAILLGVVAALGINTAPASVLSLPLLVASLLVLLVVHRERTRLLVPLLGLAAISCVSAGAPFGVNYWQYRAQMLERSNQLNIFTAHKMSQLKREIYHTDSAAEVVVRQAWAGLTGFHQGHDAQPQYGSLRPLADQYTAALMIPGVMFAVLRLRQFVATSALIFSAGYLLFGLGMHHAPGFQRAVGALPFGMALAASGLVQCCETLCAGRARLTGWARDLVLAAAVIVCGLTNLRIYFVECRTTLLAGDADSEPGWVAREFAHDYHVHFVDWFAPGPLGLQLIIGDLPVSYNNLRDPVAYAKSADVTGADLFIVHGEDMKARDALLGRFPDARLEVRRRHPVHGPTLFLVFVGRPGTPPGLNTAVARESSEHRGGGPLSTWLRWAGYEGP